MTSSNEPRRAAAQAWPLLVLVVVLLWLWRDTAAGMVSIWIRSATFTHAFLVVPISAWLVWRRRDELAGVPVRPVPWLLLAIAATCFVWMLGELAAVSVASQFALVTVLILSVPALFGWQLTRRLAFPLLFLYFAVPFGEFLVPRLMEWTADFTVSALRASGVPVYREGLEFVIPSGQWSVVEACSGVRYLIASFMVGTLFAYITYRSTRRRLLFVVAALLVPVVANWLRAYMIVMIGHLSGNELAVGVDHLIYGWVFFGLVIGAMFFVGVRWAEPEEAFAAPAQAADLPPAGRGGWAVAAAIALMLAGTQAWLWQFEHDDAAAPTLALPPAPAGWTAANAPLPWAPEFPDASAVATQAQDHDGQRVWLWTAYYRQQTDERKLISSVHGIVDMGEGAQWHRVDSGSRAAQPPIPALRTATIRNRLGADLSGAVRLRVWHLYWIGGRWTTSEVRAKVWQAIDRLLGRGDDGAVVLIATPLTGTRTDDADAVLETFARAQFGAVDAALGRTRDTR